MPVPLPSAADADHSRPDAAGARLVAQGVVAAIRPAAGLTPLQNVLVAALVVAMETSARTRAEAEGDEYAPRTPDPAR